jgi:hypothetical protein
LLHRTLVPDLRGLDGRLVDGDGFRLPGLWDRSEVEKIAMPLITGVASPPGKEGQQWPGSDLQAPEALQFHLPLPLKNDEHLLVLFRGVKPHVLPRSQIHKAGSHGVCPRRPHDHRVWGRIDGKDEQKRGWMILRLIRCSPMRIFVGKT